MQPQVNTARYQFYHVQQLPGLNSEAADKRIARSLPIRETPITYFATVQPLSELLEETGPHKMR